MTEDKRPHVLVISGFDPSAGAGILADVKTLEALKVYAFGIVSALTHQDHEKIYSISWISLNEIIENIDILLNKYDISVCKIGIVESTEVLCQIIKQLKKRDPTIRLIVDPVIKSSSGFRFQDDMPKQKWQSILSELYLLTPNNNEMRWLSGNEDTEEAAELWSVYGNILLKGGHNEKHFGIDLLFEKKIKTPILNSNKQLWEKHGSGCILSSAIAAYVALGLDLVDACKQGKKYVEKALSSNSTLLAYH
ncbi:Phosphomethylpyrimidine kinase [Pseudopedobacter saltans DSM 12145]|uniref:hydroxymethylpyrimidine kinase n=1 Tax=Pseudopedobacter saltans (strain ATCC 51119 / DSM 12145 / JCM 21818 / CCUG 39354 / LMG 10337 / NBRC 100064 / NCIMB 13643) TaxID=762903 RepID=F0SEQ9_PSESL|nr:hydroxymethylpyrimidine/phosphomethylpyrimidine kinase [Pseudopedobacter saltans]ADY51949.1 Phosphomethylpyrimidine kinase [Pseudopedobacter saltans DSM 12145]